MKSWKKYDPPQTTRLFPKFHPHWLWGELILSKGNYPFSPHIEAYSLLARVCPNHNELWVSEPAFVIATSPPSRVTYAQCRSQRKIFISRRIRRLLLPLIALESLPYLVRSEWIKGEGAVDRSHRCLAQYVNRRSEDAGSRSATQF